MSSDSSQFAKEFRAGWQPLLGAIIGVGAGLTGIVFYTHGVFVVPITQEFGWSRGATQFAFSFVMISAALTGPFIGVLTDKLGARKLALFSMFALSISFAALSLTTDQIWTYYALWIFMAIIAAGTFPVTWTRGVITWFDGNRGLALGLTMMGTGLVAAAGPLYAAWLIQTFGWREAYQAIGATLLIVAFPIAYFFFHERDVTGKGEHSRPAMEGMEPKEAIFSYRFWAMGIALLFICYGVGGLISNLVPMLMDKGYQATEAASYAGFVGTMVIVGRLVVGYLIDRVWAPMIACIFLIIPAVSCLLLAQDVLSPVSITIAAMAVGLAAGAELDIIAFMTSRYFGMKHYGKLYGGQFIFFAVGSGAAPAVFGWSYDTMGSYEFILYSTAVLFVIGALLFLSMGKYPDFKEQE
ncbi:MAG: MFS transporter [Alphaproteobacteria bacterium]|nr:MFS transporter [Alphaproteobacteria bacterium]